jgi:hypothetical protein
MEEKTLLEELKEFGVSNRLYNALYRMEATWDFVLPNPEIIKKGRHIGEVLFHEFLKFLHHTKRMGFFLKDTTPFTSPSKIILNIELPLEQTIAISNPIYIPKLNELFIVEFSNFISNKKITDELEDMDDNEQFRVLDYFSIFYVDKVMIYIRVGQNEEREI